MKDRSHRFRFLRVAVVDVTALRVSVPFRWLYIGQVGIHFGRQILVVAVPLQVFELTGSSLIVGMVGLVQTLPLLMASLIGGTVADAFDRRKVLVSTQLFSAVVTAGLALNSGAEGRLWPIFALMAVNAATMGVESPTRTAIIPTVVPRVHMASAFAISQTLTQTAAVVGPAVAGLLIARLGTGPVYWIAVAVTLAGALAAIPLGALPPEGGGGRVGLSAAVEGWRFLRSRPLLQHVMLIDFNAMVFGLPRALFPYIGTVTMGGDAATVGLLNAAPGAGALVAALTTGWVSMVKRQGRMVVLAVVVWGLSIMAFGFTTHLETALVLLAVAGAGDVISNVFRATILQLGLPDAFRGRVTSFKVMLSGAGPRLGDFEAGAVAAVTTPQFAVISGGAASVIGAVLIAWRGRTLWTQNADEMRDENEP